MLDDVWDAHLWGKLHHAFVDEGTGSRVVITTRSGDVAKAAASDRTMVLEPLLCREAWTLFCNVAFREVPGRTCPSHLMHPVTRNEFGRAKRRRIHDLIRELIMHRSREEEGFIQFANCNQIPMDGNVRMRHLALDRCERVDSQHVPRMATLRTFHAFGSELDASFLSCFRLLTVLNLWFIKMNRLPSSVTSLHNLRYLGVRSTFIEVLPKELGKLQNLQILDAKLSEATKQRCKAEELAPPDSVDAWGH